MLTTCAQTLWKIGSTAIGQRKVGIVELILLYAKSPFVLAGFLLSAIAAVMWTYSLSRFDFSYASFVGSLSYVLVILVSLLVFRESISPARWIGCGFIMMGIIFVLRS